MTPKRIGGPPSSHYQFPLQTSPDMRQYPELGTVPILFIISKKGSALCQPLSKFLSLAHPDVQKVPGFAYYCGLQRPTAYQLRRRGLKINRRTIQLSCDVQLTISDAFTPSWLTNVANIVLFPAGRVNTCVLICLSSIYPTIVTLISSATASS